MLYYLLTSLYVFVCMVLLMVILLQQGKGGDMASAFGGGSSQTAFGARGGATLLDEDDDGVCGAVHAGRAGAGDHRSARAEFDRWRNCGAAGGARVECAAGSGDTSGAETGISATSAGSGTTAGSAEVVRPRIWGSGVNQTHQLHGLPTIFLQAQRSILTEHGF